MCQNIALSDYFWCSRKKNLILFQVFNTVLSCLKTQKQQNAISFLPPEAKVWCGNVLDCLSKVLKKLFDEDILVVGQGPDSIEKV